MYLQSISGLNKEVKETSYYKNKIKPTDKLLLIDKCNFIIHSIVEGNRHNWYVQDYGEVQLMSKILIEQLGSKINRRNGKAEYINIINLLIELNYIKKDESYISTDMADVENKKRLKKGVMTSIRPESKTFWLTLYAKNKGIKKVGVLSKRSEERILRYRFRELEKYYKNPFHKNIMDNIFNLHFNYKKASPILKNVQLNSKIELKRLAQQNNTTQKAKLKEKKQADRIIKKLEFYERIFATLKNMNGYSSAKDYFLTEGFYYKVSNKVDRLYHFHSTIPTSYRECMSNKKRKVLGEMDLSNSQPLFIALKFNKIEPQFFTKDRLKVFIDRNNIGGNKEVKSICITLALINEEKRELLSDVLNGNFYKKIANEGLRQGNIKFSNLYQDNYKKFKQKVLGNGLYGRLRSIDNVLKEEKYIMALYPNFMKWIRHIKITEGYKAVPIII